jgi:hypothetical protein
MSTRLVVCLTAVMGLMCAVPAAQAQHLVVVADASGQDRAQSEPRAGKPTGVAASRPEIMVFFLQQDVRDAKGRVVTGLGFVTWMEADDAHVAVFTMVPKPGAPNTFLGTREQMASLQPLALVDFVLKLGGSRSLDELKALGVDPMVVTFK